MTVIAFTSPPLVVPELSFSKKLFPTIQLHLDEPLISSKDLRELLSLCAIADTCIERVLRVHGATFDETLLQRIETLCKQAAPDREPLDLLNELGILTMYPYLHQGLEGDEIEDCNSRPGASYLSYVSALNQVAMMATQLFHDACVPQNHKYTAHQLALLYQSLNQLQGDTKPIRRLVEARFDTIKTITESKNPLLDIELSNWLQEITWLCREEIKSCPPYIHKRLRPVTAILQSQ